MSIIGLFFVGLILWGFSIVPVFGCITIAITFILYYFSIIPAVAFWIMAILEITTCLISTFIILTSK
jgi:hypothetical protein